MADVQTYKSGNLVIYYRELTDGTLSIENVDAFNTAKDKRVAPAAVMPRPVGKFEVPKNINGKAITSIGPAAFFLCRQLDEVVLPMSIKSIGEGAFAHCFNLRRILIPKSCTAIGESAFAGCLSLKSIQIPIGVTNIGSMAFAACKSLRDISLPENLTHIGAAAFTQCTELTEVKIPGTVEKLEPCTFQGCSNLVSVTLNRRYKSPAGSFRKCPKIEKLNGLFLFEEIDLDDFEGTQMLRGAVAKNGLLMVDDWVFGFEPNNKGEYVIPANIKPVGLVFSNLPQPSKVFIDGDCPYLRRMFFSEFKGAFEDCTNLISLTIGRSSKRDKNNGVLRGRAFKNCKNLKSVVIKEGVQCMGGEVFAGCDSLEYFTLPYMPMTSYRLWMTSVPLAYRQRLYEEALDNAQVACMYIIHSFNEVAFKNGSFNHKKFFSALNTVTDYMAKHPNKNADGMRYCMEVFDNIANCLDALQIPANKAIDKSRIPSQRDVKMYQRMMYRALANIYHDAYSCTKIGDDEADNGNVTAAVEYYKMAARAYAEKEIEDEKKCKENDEDGVPSVTARQCMSEAIEKIRCLGFAKTAELLLAEMDEKIENGRVVGKQKGAVTGTGWAVSPSHLVTCWHVVKDAKKVSCEFTDGSVVELSLVVADKANDIAILKMPRTRRFDRVLSLRPKPLKISESIFTIGYPLTSILGQSQKYTEGSISAVSGIDNDVRFYQISAPIQPGNSGGPLVDLNGDVVGITSSGLNALMTAGATGTIPQNVNYAIKVRYLTALLDDNNISYEITGKNVPKDIAVSNVEKATVLIKAE